MAVNNKSSEVLLLLKKQGMFSKAMQVKAKLVQPNLKKIFYENGDDLKKKFYDIVFTNNIQKKY